ncbi:hypothetical protein F383_38636 [Gossypium arboreum]|uniref:Uncharacterized protein n=1 Tax=Gossypium arboreum TaxID=29729 RepID=A0A0B0MLN9_GOSAR|nr:hypothetical protein F383_38636 [Gossypium arboreum]
MTYTGRLYTRAYSTTLTMGWSNCTRGVSHGHVPTEPKYSPI